MGNKIQYDNIQQIWSWRDLFPQMWTVDVAWKARPALVFTTEHVIEGLCLHCTKHWEIANLSLPPLRHSNDSDPQKWPLCGMQSLQVTGAGHGGVKTGAGGYWRLVDCPWVACAWCEHRRSGGVPRCVVGCIIPMLHRWETKLKIYLDQVLLIVLCVLLARFVSHVATFCNFYLVNLHFVEFWRTLQLLAVSFFWELDKDLCLISIWLIYILWNSEENCSGWLVLFMELEKRLFHGFLRHSMRTSDRLHQSRSKNAVDGARCVAANTCPVWRRHPAG